MPLRINVKNGSRLTLQPSSNFRIGLLTQVVATVAAEIVDGWSLENSKDNLDDVYGIAMAMDYVAVRDSSKVIIYDNSLNSNSTFDIEHSYEVSDVYYDNYRKSIAMNNKYIAVCEYSKDSQDSNIEIFYRDTNLTPAVWMRSLHISIKDSHAYCIDMYKDIIIIGTHGNNTNNHPNVYIYQLSNSNQHYEIEELYPIMNNNSNIRFEPSSKIIDVAIVKNYAAVLLKTANLTMIFLYKNISTQDGLYEWSDFNDSNQGSVYESDLDEDIISLDINDKFLVFTTTTGVKYLLLNQTTLIPNDTFLSLTDLSGEEIILGAQVKMSKDNGSDNDMYGDDLNNFGFDGSGNKSDIFIATIDKKIHHFETSGNEIDYKQLIIEDVNKNSVDSTNTFVSASQGKNNKFITSGYKIKEVEIYTYSKGEIVGTG